MDLSRGERFDSRWGFPVGQMLYLIGPVTTRRIAGKRVGLLGGIGSIIAEDRASS